MAGSAVVSSAVVSSAVMGSAAGALATLDAGGVTLLRGVLELVVCIEAVVFFAEFALSAELVLTAPAMLVEVSATSDAPTHNINPRRNRPDVRWGEGTEPAYVDRAVTEYSSMSLRQFGRRGSMLYP